MNSLSVAAVAERLEVSPRRVRQLLSAGELVGVRVGRDWVIDGDEIERHRIPRRPGRPWKPESAWAILAAENGDEPAGSPVERSRARRRLSGHGLVALADRLRARSNPRRFYGHPAALERLALEPGVVLGGVSAAAAHGADLVGGDLLEAYVPSRRLAALVRRYGLEAAPERHNLVLRIVDDAVWPFASDVKVAPRPVVAVDLLDAADERSRRAGRELAGRI
jgi:excisionase family DNA binding protein